MDIVDETTRGSELADAPENYCNPTGQSEGTVRQPEAHHETADNYERVIARLNGHWRVINCKDDWQWILQRRDAERSGQPRWTGHSYFRTKSALIRVSRTSCGRINPKAMAILQSLPNRFGENT